MAIVTANGSVIGSFQTLNQNRNQYVSRGKRGMAGNIWFDEYYNHPYNALYDEKFVTLIKYDKNAPGFVKVMAPYLDWLYENRPWASSRKYMLKYRLKEESRFICYPYWVDEWEYKSIKYILELLENRKRMKELYELFKEID